MSYKIFHVWVYTLKTKDDCVSHYVDNFAVNLTVDSIDEYRATVKLKYGQNVMVCLQHSEIIPDDVFAKTLVGEMKVKVKTK